MILTTEQQRLIDKAQKIIICQAENPDGDSLGSALALENILADLGKDISLYCPVQIPSYLMYYPGADRVTSEFDNSCDLAIIVDTSSATLMSKSLQDPLACNFFHTHPVLVIDHHAGVEPDLPFGAEYIIADDAIAAAEVIFDIAREQGWKIDTIAAQNIYCAIQSDSLGLTTVDTSAKAFRVCADLIDLGVSPAHVEELRRESMKKSQRILAYKGQLIERIEYLNDGRTALITIPFDEIHEYSNEYNPTMLVIDEMKMVLGVDVAIGIKTYPDGKLTGKIRSNIPVANLLAKSFGGDGHPFAAGFRVYESYREFLPELVNNLYKIYDEHDASQQGGEPNTEPDTHAESLPSSEFKAFRIRTEKK